MKTTWPLWITYNLAEDQTELFIPMQIEGRRVGGFNVETLPASVKTVYTPINRGWEGWIDGERELTMIQYADQDWVMGEDWFSKYLGDMGEDDYALIWANVYSWKDGEMREKDAPDFYAEQLLAELNGHKVRFEMLNNCNVIYTSGEWQYAYSNNDMDSISIKDVTGVVGQTTLFVPSTIEGVQVGQVDNIIADKYGITLFVAPRNGWFYGEGKASFGVLYYYDRAWVDSRENDYYTERYAWMGENDLSVEDYTHYANGESTKETIEYKDIPTEVEGKTIVNNMYFDDNVTVHKKDDYSYIILADDTIAITKYENELAKSLIIPARIDGKTVTALMSDGWNAVISSSELTSLELPSTLKVLGKRAISAWSLKKLEIPEGVTEIGENAIYAYKVSSIKLPEGVTKLGKNWMYSKTKSVSFPSTLTTLEENAFSYSDNIASIKLPDTVTNVGKAAFSEMDRLTSLTLPENMVEIPERLAAASERLAKITIPAATETIGKQAFAGCTKLATVNFAKKDAQIKVIGDGAFAGAGVGKIALPEGLTTIGKEAFQGSEKLSSVSMHDNITSIEPYAFSGCTKLTKISLSESLTTIKEGTFMGCKKLASVTIPESVTAIEDFAFEGCASKLTLTVTEGSFAHQWAEANGYKVKLAK